MKTQAWISTVAFAVAGVGLAIGVYDLVSRKGTEKPRASVQLEVGLGTAFLSGVF